MTNKIPRRIANSVMNSLRGGVVPRIGLEYIAVGRKDEIEALLSDVDMVMSGGASFRFIVGKYGSGKSFLLQTIRNYTMEKNFVVLDADLSPERRLVGNKGQGLATYRELVKNMATRTKPDGGALPLILEKWLSGIQSAVLLEYNLSPDEPEFEAAVNKKVLETLNSLDGMVNGFDFSRMLLLYRSASKDSDEEKKARVLKWFKGEYATKTEVKNELGVNILITDDNWYDYLKLFAGFLVGAGYGGMLVLIDELVNLFKIPHTIARQYNYEKILTMYNDVLQGKAEHIGIIMGGTPQCIEDPHKGIFSYEALKSRLEEGRFAREKGYRDMLSPIIRLAPLSHEELFVLVEKLAMIHGELYDYTVKLKQEDYLCFLQTELSRVGADTKVTPREIIRDFIELLNLSMQNKDTDIRTILGGGNFTFAEDRIGEEAIHQEFADFEL